MKLKIKKRKEGVAVAALDDKVEAAVRRFNTAMGQLEDVLVERSTEVQALKLCLLSKEHLMLEGPPGVAKSRFAHEAFERITGARIFSTQLTSTTQPDAILGCMNTKKYREQAIWEYNVSGMLPDCHLAFIDEVYRGARSLLPNMMQILNEKTFYNGVKEIKCPLMTAVGTTNFTTMDDELNAFHDRWLVKVKVSPLSSPSARVKALSLFLSQNKGHLPFAQKYTVSLSDLELIHRAVQGVEIPHEVLKLYEEVIGAFCKDTKVTVSDRRLCQTLKLIQAAYVMDEGRPTVLNEGYVASAQNGIAVLNNEEHGAAFATVFERIIGTRMQDIALAAKLQRLEAHVVAMEAEYDDDMTFQQAEDLYKTATTYLQACRRLDANDPVPRGDNEKVYNKILSKLEVLVNSVKPIVLRKIDKEVEAELND